MLKCNKLCFTAIFTVLLFSLGTTSVTAQDYSFSWSANSEPVEGYKLYYKQGGEAGPDFNGTDAAGGQSPIDLGKVTSCTISGLQEDAIYHFALTAYSGTEESGYTDIITVNPSEKYTKKERAESLIVIINYLLLNE